MRLYVYVALQVVVDTEGRTGGWLTARLEWERAEPLVIRFLFDDAEPLADGTRPVWVIGRDLLADGGGHGRVRVERSRWKMRLTIESVDVDGGSSTLEAQLNVIDPFLHRTYDQVRRGDEVDDEEITAFIRSCSSSEFGT